MVIFDWYKESRQQFVASGTIRMLAYCFSFILSLLLSLVLTPPVRGLVKRLGLMDVPGGRRIHEQPTPRAGGIAVFVAFHVTLILVKVLFGDVIRLSYGETKLWSFMIASSLLLGVGIWDDARDIKPLVKLAGQIGAALILYFGGFRVGGGLAIVLPQAVDLVVTLFWIVGAINAFNLIDGMDGLAAGLAAIAALGLAGALFLRNLSTDALPFLALAGASLGFLRYNFNPASIFLGDCGSMFLGLAVGALPLVSGQKSELLASLGVPLIAMGIPIFDTMLAIWRRSMRALFPEVMEVGAKRIRGFMDGDKEHIHHRVLARFVSQRRAAGVLYIFSILLVAIGLYLVVAAERRLGVFLVAFIVAVFLIVKHMVRVELWDTGRILLARTPRSVSVRIAVPFYITVDVVVMLLALALSHLITGIPCMMRNLVLELPFVVSVIFIVLALTGNYNRIWSRALLRDYLWFIVSFVMGLAAFVVGVEFFVKSCQVHTNLVLTFILLSLPLMILARIIRDVLREAVSLIETSLMANRPDSVRVLVCGGGERLRAYLREHRFNIGKRESLYIVGALDDDPNLWGRKVFGIKVVGALKDMATKVEELNISEVLITAKMTEERRQELSRQAQSLPVKIKEWSLEVKPVEITERGRDEREV